MSVHATVKRVTIPTYVSAEHEKLPMFAENRVHQRSSGNPYPNPIVNQIKQDQKIDQEYEIIILENEYLYLELLPEFGGRIITARDKTNGYDFFYRQHVIKPALVGLLGLWVSGGLEFNWPVHHRPSTMLPVDYVIEPAEDGAVTVWLSEHEPLDRMKGIVGVRLSPGKAIFDTLMRVYNRTDLPKSFLWWENSAVPVNPDYEIFFPPDVSFVNYHYKKATGGYPVMDEFFNTQDNRGGKDIRFHKNTEDATSYFSGLSSYDFFGGYDQGKQAGVVHYAPHETSVGKKMFTWGYKSLARSWETALTDTDGAYAELMASSYSDNQPDFTWLEPFEVKEFSQSWYPIKDLGPVTIANDLLAVHCSASRIGIYPVASIDQVHVALVAENGRTVSKRMDLKATEVVWLDTEEVQSLSITDSLGNEVLTYTATEPSAYVAPPKSDDPLPGEVATADACYLAGLHVDQYRDPILEADVYWLKGIALEVEHAPCLTGLGRYYLNRLQYKRAEEYLRRAVNSLTRHNPNPRDTEALYLLGLSLKRQHAYDEAYEVLQKAMWSRASIFHSALLIAQIDCIREDFSKAKEHLVTLSQTAGFNQKAEGLLASVLRRLGEHEPALQQVEKILKLDRLDYFALNEKRLLTGDDQMFSLMHSDSEQTCIDIASDYADAGMNEEAAELLTLSDRGYPMISYLRGYLLGDPRLYQKGSQCDESFCFPSRVWESEALEAALRETSTDEQAHLYLGNLLYGRCRLHELAGDHWAQSGRGVQALRNQAIAVFNNDHTDRSVIDLLEEALQLEPENLQLLYERNQVLDIQHIDPKEQYALWESAGELVTHRDDLFLQGIHILNCLSEHQKALESLCDHTFIPCEGGEHAVANEYLTALFALGLEAMHSGDFAHAVTCFQRTFDLPSTLGGGLWHEVMLTPYHYLQGRCLEHLGRDQEAVLAFHRVTDFPVNYFTNRYLPSFRYWKAKALERLGDEKRSTRLFHDFLETTETGLITKDHGYFSATPFFHVFNEPSETTRIKHWGILHGYALEGVRKREAAREMIQRVLDVDPYHCVASLLLRYYL
mgnify:CR=1 FL=1